MKLSDIIRIVLTVVLLYFVWNNVHWSVALVLTLVGIQCEYAGYTLRIIAKKYKESTVFKNMFH